MKNIFNHTNSNKNYEQNHRTTQNTIVITNDSTNKFNVILRGELKYVTFILYSYNKIIYFLKSKLKL